MSPRPAFQVTDRTPIAELHHALRHVVAAESEVRWGDLELARVHVREALSDLRWTLRDIDRLGRESPSGGTQPRTA